MRKAFGRKGKKGNHSEGSRKESKKKKGGAPVLLHVQKEIDVLLKVEDQKGGGNALERK